MSKSPMLTVRLDRAEAVREYVEGEIAETTRLLTMASRSVRTEPAALQLVGRLEAFSAVLRRLTGDVGKARRAKASPSPSLDDH